MTQKGIQSNIRSMLLDKVHAVSTSTGVLSRLFRIVINDLDITYRQWNRLMVNYLDDPDNGIPPSGRERSTERGNMNKQLSSDPMSIKTFIKGMKFLRVRRLKFTVELERDDCTTAHSVYMDLTVPGANDSEEHDD